MKKIVFMFLFLLYLWQNSFSQENNIWGVWNTDNRENGRVTTNEDGSFIRSWDWYSFHSNYYGGPVIRMQGYLYRIKEIILNKRDIVSLYVEISAPHLFDHPLINAKIVMHFIDQDHMWMEFDRNDEKYPTDPRFEEHPFNQGQDVIFWRERVK